MSITKNHKPIEGRQRSLVQSITARILVGLLLVCSGLSKGAQAPTQPPSAAAAPDGDVKLNIIDGSTASFNFQEQLAGAKSLDEVTGASSAITGTLVLAPDGTVVPSQSKFSIDLRTLKSDLGMRDAYIQKVTLETDKFPTADFVPRRIQGMPNPLPQTGQTIFHLIGDMTIHGVTKEVTCNGNATFSGDGAVGNCTSDFVFATFGLSKPMPVHVLNVDDRIHLKVDFKAELSRATPAASTTAPGAGHGFLIDRHLAAGMRCNSCHITDPPPTPPTMTTCLSCHGGTYSKLSAMTEADTPNPHDSPHQAEIPCAMCHHVHKASQLLCNQCHTLDLKIP